MAWRKVKRKERDLILQKRRKPRLKNSYSIGEGRWERERERERKKEVTEREFHFNELFFKVRLKYSLFFEPRRSQKNKKDERRINKMVYRHQTPQRKWWKERKNTYWDFFFFHPSHKAFFLQFPSFQAQSGKGKRKKKERRKTLLVAEVRKGERLDLRNLI